MPNSRSDFLLAVPKVAARSFAARTTAALTGVALGASGAPTGLAGGAVNATGRPPTGAARGAARDEVPARLAARACTAIIAASAGDTKRVAHPAAQPNGVSPEASGFVSWTESSTSRATS